MTTTLNKTETFSRLRWLCRRGMLELDLLLMGFLDKYDGELSVQEQKVLYELLQCSDQDLYAWLFGQRPVSDARFEPLLRKMRP